MTYSGGTITHLARTVSVLALITVGEPVWFVVLLEAPVNFDRLRTFRLVVQHESFSRAADELFLSQPAVSLQIRQLERELGVRLLERGNGRIKPTPAGEVVLEFARLVEDERTNLLQRLARLESGELLVTIACSATSASRFIPLVISELRRRAPEVHVRVMIVPPDEAVARLQRGEVDLILTTEAFLSDRVEGARYSTARLFLVGPPSHPLARKPRVKPEELQYFPFALLPPPWSVQSRVRDWAANQGIEIKVVMESGSYDSLIETVRKGLALSVVAETAVAEEVARGSLAVIRTPGMPIEYPIFLAHRPGPLPPHVAAVKAIILERKLSQRLPRLAPSVVSA